MGTWGFGPYDNDAASDDLARVFTLLLTPVDAFVAHPLIDETFWPSYGAISSMSALMQHSPARPWTGAGVLDPGPVVASMRSCAAGAVDREEIDAELLGALEPVLDRFEALVNDK